AEAHLALGFHLLSSERNYSAALKELSIAEKTSPNNAEVLFWQAIIYRRQGRWREAIANFQKAESLDARNSRIVSHAAINSLLVRDWEAASAGFKRVRALEPQSGSTLAYCEIVRTGELAPGDAILRELPAHISIFRRWDL